MKKTFGLGLVACVLALSLSTTSCYSGPRRLSNSWNDWTNQKYSENAWMHAILSTPLPVYPIVEFAAGFADLFYNAYYFWSKDAWDNKGTAYVHKNPEGATKTVAGSGLGM